MIPDIAQQYHDYLDSIDSYGYAIERTRWTNLRWAWRERYGCDPGLFTTDDGDDPVMHTLADIFDFFESLD
jgi:hypothetical protein